MSASLPSHVAAFLLLAAGLGGALSPVRAANASAPAVPADHDLFVNPYNKPWDAKR